MAIGVKCGSCGKSYKVKDELAGRKAKCRCGAVMQVPAAKPPAPDEYDFADDALVSAAAAEQSARPIESSPSPAGPAHAPPPLPRTTRGGVSITSTRKRAVDDSTNQKSLLVRIGGGILVVLMVLGLAARIYRTWNRVAINKGAVTTDNSAPARLPDKPKMNPTSDGLQRGVATIEHGSLRTRVVVILPAGEHSAANLPCMLYAPAGSNLLSGMELTDADEEEAKPFAEAGFAVVLYSISGHLDNPNLDAAIIRNVKEFMAADGGAVNARVALDFALKAFPEIDPGRVFCAGHSSAATLALQLSSRESRLKGCVAMAPAMSIIGHFGAANIEQLDRAIPGLEDFAVTHSPSRIAPNCPVFISHGDDDNITPVSDSRDYASRNTSKVTLFTVPHGGHRAPFSTEATRNMMAWLRQQGAWK